MASEQTVSDALIELLLGVGIRTVYGIIGGAIAPFADALGRSDLRFIATRHEAGAAFAATEASLAAGRPTAVLTTTGPGLANALTGLLAARSDGAHVISISACTAVRQRGRYAVQEMSGHGLVLPSLLVSAFDLAVTVEVPEQLIEFGAWLTAGLRRPQGFVASIALPVSVQRAPFEGRLIPHRLAAAYAPAHIGLNIVSALQEPFVIWAGFGARHAGAEIIALAERTGAGILLTPRAKGVVPEDHPLCCGVTGIGGSDTETLLGSMPIRPRRALVLGSRLGEFSSLWDPRLAPPDGFIHVDLDPDIFGAAYPDIPTVSVVADVAQFLRALLARLPYGPIGGGRDLQHIPHGEPARLAMTNSPVRPQALMQALQEVVVDGGDALVFAEPGNAFTWSNHLLRFPNPRYRLSGYWASMGHMVTGAVGASLETGRSSVVLTGDGAMLMLSEMSTAANYRAPVVWVVLNDARYGMTEAGMRAQSFTPHETRFPRVDFAVMARAVGAEGLTVEHEADLADALQTALDARAPFVVDVRIDPSEVAPMMGRISSLAAMGAR